MASSIDASAYYRNLYPYELVYDWQNFDASGDSYRELAICDEQDRWYRFLAFKSLPNTLIFLISVAVGPLGTGF